MITVLSLMLSFAVAPAVSKVTANYLVSQQVQQMQEEEKNNEGKVSTEYVAPKQDVQSISVEVTPEMYLLDGVKCSCVDNGFCSGIWNCNTKEKPERYFIGNELGGRRKC